MFELGVYSYICTLQSLCTFLPYIYVQSIYYIVASVNSNGTTEPELFEYITILPFTAVLYVIVIKKLHDFANILFPSLPSLLSFYGISHYGEKSFATLVKSMFVELFKKYFGSFFIVAYILNAYVPL